MNPQILCPECNELKPRDPSDPHDLVLERMDFRQAGRPERQKITDPVGRALMCLACHARITVEYAPKAPFFDDLGNRITSGEGKQWP